MAEVERVTDQEQTAEVFENDIDLFLQLFCEEQGIEDLKRESQGVWNACLIFINRNVFKDKSKLKYNKPLKGYYNNNYNNEHGKLNQSNCNAYDPEIIEPLCDYYIYLCYRYDKEVSIMGFSKLTGIDTDTINSWGNEENKLSTASSVIHKKLHQEREESLAAKLVSNKHPVAVISVLNKNYGWNLPGVSKENSNKRTLTAQDLPRLDAVPGADAHLIEDKDTTSGGSE